MKTNVLWVAFFVLSTLANASVHSCDEEILFRANPPADSLVDLPPGQTLRSIPYDVAFSVLTNGIREAEEQLMVCRTREASLFREIDDTVVRRRRRSTGEIVWRVRSPADATRRVEIREELDYYLVEKHHARVKLAVLNRELEFQMLVRSPANAEFSELAARLNILFPHWKNWNVMNLQEDFILRVGEALLNEDAPFSADGTARAIQRQLRGLASTYGSENVIELLPEILMEPALLEGPFGSGSGGPDRLNQYRWRLAHSRMVAGMRVDPMDGSELSRLTGRIARSRAINGLSWLTDSQINPLRREDRRVMRAPSTEP